MTLLPLIRTNVDRVPHIRGDFSQRADESSQGADPGKKGAPDVLPGALPHELKLWLHAV